VIKKFLRETAGFSKYPPDSVPQPAIVSLNTFCVFFANNMAIGMKNSDKTIPFICSICENNNTPIAILENFRVAYATDSPFYRHTTPHEVSF
jgi:hypothetical protein